MNLAMSDTMRALLLENYGEAPQVGETAVPPLKAGEVLVKVAAAPVNPSDVIFMQGRYGVKKPLPVVPGFEGCGTVVAAGDGLLPQVWKGRRVAFVIGRAGSGSWAEYAAAPAHQCIPLPSHLSDAQGATAIVNPATAVALFEMARAARARAVVSTAAASAVGRMLLRLGNQRAVPVIHIVRRQEQVDLLCDLGGQFVLNSNDPAFDADLRHLCRDLNATMCFDAVAGELTGRVLDAMPGGSTAVVYGALSNQPVQVNPGQFIFKNKRVTGFWLAEPLNSLSPVAMARVLVMARAVLAGDAVVQSEIRQTVSLDDAAAGIQAYKNNMTAGKILITPEILIKPSRTSLNV